MKIIASVILIFAVCLAFIFAAASICGDDLPVFSQVTAITDKTQSTAVKIVIDPGHGGIDSGTVSKNGTFEKDINLKIAKKTASVLKKEGINAILTREDDRMLDSENSNSRKLSDLQNRVQFAKENKNSLFVSIHQNALPLESCRGLQVFFSDNSPLSKVFAMRVQKNAKTFLQNDNERKIKNSGSSIFLLDRIDTPAILIECGFLSNKTEAMLLSDEIYQQKLSVVIANSIIEILSELGEFRQR